jgi:hypothetical protein
VNLRNYGVTLANRSRTPSWIGVKALGGAEKLGTGKVFSWIAEGTVTFNGNEGPLAQ